MYMKEGSFPADPPVERQRSGAVFQHPTLLDSWGPKRTLSGAKSYVSEGFVIGCTWGALERVSYARTYAVTCHREIEIRPVVIGFFNGVWNTRWQAQRGLEEIEKLLGKEHKGRALLYDWMYNQTGSENGSTGLQDLAEVFIQRDRELNGLLSQRWEYFWELLSGVHRHDDALTQNLVNKLGRQGGDLVGLMDAMLENLLAKVASGWAYLLSNPPTAADMEDHIRSLKQYGEGGYHVVLMGHSQGNLFVNPAYDYVRNTLPFTQIAAVHIAPASPTLRGDHLLADIDLVINGLRLHGGPNTVPSVNIPLPYALLKDASGHTLAGTYLDSDRAARDSIKSLLSSALEHMTDPGSIELH